MRGSDIEANPVFFSYAIVTLNELHLYVLDRERINYNIENHFAVEKIEVLAKEYNTTLVGINSVVSMAFAILFPICLHSQNIAR